VSLYECGRVSVINVLVAALLSAGIVTRGTQVVLYRRSA
jgi:hypothetical protein